MAEITFDSGRAPNALVYKPEGDCWLAFSRPQTVLSAGDIEAVREVIATAELGTKEGLWAVGFLAYEAAPAFDPALLVQGACPSPLAWFALCDPPVELATEDLPSAADFEIGSLSPTLSAAAHREGVQRIHRWIERGDTYQVNFTHHLEGRFDGDPWGLFLELWRNQRCDYAAWIDTGELALCSVSPELFFELENGSIRCRPMKGTARRGRTTAEDRRQTADLAGSAKDRAENVMIVDMIRNDLGRVARAGTVRTVSLCDIERYDSVFQLTSTIEAETGAEALDVFSALFPCASITGAPKVRTTELIRELEPGPRGVYTGAIGWLAPDRRARFSVAIRTAVVDRGAGRLSYGTGGGIVWDSKPEAEYRECADKARVLTGQRPDFALLETLCWEPGRGFELVEQHLDRLCDSGDYFGIVVDREAAQARLEHAVGGDLLLPLRVRLVVSRAGVIEVTTETLRQLAEPLSLELAAAPVDSGDPFLLHKTTHREAYDRALRDRPGATDVMLWNERGELTETTIANLALELSGELCTPPIASGLLAGTMRGCLLAQGEITERVLYLEDLVRASRIEIFNSVRGRLAIELAPGVGDQMKQALTLLRNGKGRGAAP